MSLPALRDSPSELANLCEELGIEPDRLEHIRDEILEEKIQSSEQLATLLSISVADARRVLASTEISQDIMLIFRKAMLLELDLLEVPMLMNIARSESMSPTPRLRATKRLRQILETKTSGPKVQVNVQQNNYPGEAGFVDQKILQRSRHED